MKGINWWNKIRHFSIDEFDSPDEKGSGSNMQYSTMLMLEVARQSAGIPFIITSGYRTEDHNRTVGGIKGSSHTKGFAVDILATTSSDRFQILKACMEAGFTRIGVADTFIHVDNDPDKAAGVIWTYRRRFSTSLFNSKKVDV